ncbi:hypothetical protein PMAYCL1PPCAC_06231, partial [Pristionchus mayeri]
AFRDVPFGLSDEGEGLRAARAGVRLDGRMHSHVLSQIHKIGRADGLVAFSALHPSLPTPTVVVICVAAEHGHGPLHDPQSPSPSIAHLLLPRVQHRRHCCSFCKAIEVTHHL